MAHYAFLDENNIVVNIIAGVNEDVTQTDIDGTVVGGSTEAWEMWYGNFEGKTCKRTSYNSIGGKRRDLQTNQVTENPGFRKNYARIGYTYDPLRDAFVEPKPFNSWILNEETCLWEPPIPYPVFDKENPRYHTWNEDILNWEEIQVSE
jgi:hypothetical protein